MSKKNCIIAIRIVCACERKRFLAEDVEKGKIPCKCGDMNEVKDFKAIKHYPNKISQSYQNTLKNKLKLKGS